MLKQKKGNTSLKICTYIPVVTGVVIVFGVVGCGSIEYKIFIME